MNWWSVALGITVGLLTIGFVVVVTMMLNVLGQSLLMDPEPRAYHDAKGGK